MQKRQFLLLTLLIVIALACSLGGNSGDDQGDAASEQPAAEATEEAAAEVTEEAAAEVTEEVAVEVTEEAAVEATEEAVAEVECNDALGCVTIASGDPIKIASALVIAGPNETLGIDSQRGVEIALDDRGQVAGHDIELVAEDGGCSAEGGQTAATKIASDENIVAVVGHNCSSSCTPAAPIYNDAGLTMISPSCTAPALTGEGSHVDSLLRTAHNDNIQGRVMAEFVYNELGLTTAATIHDGSPYAEQLQQVFADVFTELGGTITAQEAVNVNDTDMRPVLTSIATGSPEFLYYPIFIAEGGFVTTQAKEVSGLENTILAGADGMISPDFIAAAGDAAASMYISGPDLGFTGGAYEDFLATHQEKYGEAPLSAFHAHAYDAAGLIFDAIDEVATKDANGDTVIGRQALRDALYATSGHRGITGNLSCNELGDCADPKIAVNQIQEGNYVPVYQGGEVIGDMIEAASSAAEALAFSDEPYIHPSATFAFARPVGWEVLTENETNGMIGSNADETVVGGIVVNAGVEFDEDDMNDFIDTVTDNLISAISDDYEIIDTQPQSDGSIYVSVNYTSRGKEGSADLFFEQHDTIVFILFMTSTKYDEMLPTWSEIVASYVVDPATAAATVAPIIEATPTTAPLPTAAPAPAATPVPAPTEAPAADSLFAPPAGGGRVYISNSFAQEINIDFGDGAGLIKIPSGAGNDFGFYHDIGPGKYRPDLSLPGYNTINIDIEIGTDQSWVLMITEGGQISFIQIY